MIYELISSIYSAVSKVVDERKSDDVEKLIALRRELKNHSRQIDSLLQKALRSQRGLK